MKIRTLLKPNEDKLLIFKLRGRVTKKVSMMHMDVIFVVIMNDENIINLAQAMLRSALAWLRLS